MTIDAAAEAVLTLIAKHPGLSSAEVASALALRKQDRLRAMRLLRERGLVSVTPRDRRTLAWSARPVAPVAARGAPDPEPRPGSGPGTTPEPRPEPPVTETASAESFYPRVDEHAAQPTAKPSALSEDQLDFLHGRGRWADPDDFGIGSPS